MDPSSTILGTARLSADDFGYELACGLVNRLSQQSRDAAQFYPAVSAWMTLYSAIDQVDRKLSRKKVKPATQARLIGLVASVRALGETLLSLASPTDRVFQRATGVTFESFAACVAALRAEEYTLRTPMTKRRAQSIFRKALAR